MSREPPPGSAFGSPGGPILGLSAGPAYGACAMGVPFMDLRRASASADQAVRDAVLRVLEHRQFILGPEVTRFEESMSALLDGAEVIGVSSGTDALLAGLMALGVKAGDRVVTSPFSFFATAGVISRLSAIPVFVDIEPTQFGIDPQKLAGLPRDLAPRAVIPVHLFGHTLDLEPFLDWAGEDVPVLEDAAQAIGGRDARGRPAGTIGRLGAFSFFPTKNLGALGDAGMLATRDAALAERLRRLRAHGQVAQYRHSEIGGNFRLDAIQAAALSAALPCLAAATATRRQNAARYQEGLQAAGLAGEHLVLPEIGPAHTVPVSWGGCVVRSPAVLVTDLPLLSTA